MEPERPPLTDAEYRLVHGPWPRWMLQLSLVKLALRTVGVPYTDAQIAGGAEDVKGKTEQDALIAYLQVMGRSLK